MAHEEHVTICIAYSILSFLLGGIFGMWAVATKEELKKESPPPCPVPTPVDPHDTYHSETQHGQ